MLWRKQNEADTEAGNDGEENIAETSKRRLYELGVV
jgi:hypothetical protein